MIFLKSKPKIEFSGAVLPAIFMLLAPYVGTDRTLAILMFTLSTGFMGLYYPGIKLNPIDLAPNYAGTVTGIVNGMGSLSGILAPITRGLMAPDVNKLYFTLIHFFFLYNYIFI